MEELVRAGLSAALADRIRYADVRIVAPQRYQHLAVQNGLSRGLTESARAGVGVRVRTERAWGFASGTELTPRAVRDIARRAVRIALASDTNARGPIRTTEERGPTHGAFSTTTRTDPFEVSVEEKIGHLVRAEKALHAGPAVKTGIASFQAWREEKWFGSSEGVQYSSSITQVGAGVSATAVESGEVQRRSLPTSFGGDYRQAGWEFVAGLDLESLAGTAGREALALLRAPTCSTGRVPIVLAPDQLALQVHESVGHAVELDRILGSEAGFAGTSYLSSGDRDRRTVGSAAMQVVADATEVGGLGTFGWDDEGVPARQTRIVEHGRLVGFLTSRESAGALGLERSGATMRAEGAGRSPLIRMTNVDLLPGGFRFDELLEGISDGLYFETNRSWSIDDKRLNFQFGTEVGRRIHRGELGELVRNPIYSGMTPEFWSALDAVGDATTWHLWGVPNCGKGQPSQVARVGHGAPAARFRDVQVRGG